MSGRAVGRIPLGMSGTAGTTADRAIDRASVVPACLAALAEAGVIFLPLQEVVREMTFAKGGPLVAWQAFVPLFVAAVGAATWFRRSARMTSVAAGAALAVGLLQAVIWGRGTPFAGAAAVLLSLAVALRVVTLAARDHRDPVASPSPPGPWPSCSRWPSEPRTPPGPGRA